MRTIRFAVIAQVAIMLCLGGCAVPQRQHHELEPPREGFASLHLYRPDQQGTDTYPVEFYVDGKPVTTLMADTFTVIEIAPGAHRVMGKMRAPYPLKDRLLPAAEFEARAGRSYIVYPIARIAVENLPPWPPLEAYVVALATGGRVFLLPGGGDVTLEHYWQLADDTTEDAFVDQMKWARRVDPSGR